ncbi:hypothetical protein TRFO_03455 [Tritrichomonas foetus]|uniref:Uncharacterized protein n=1 Tax=Tritrichomonas foetus TaxID=1144522 RepID=A0A1J4KP21_9EUKA|nr:hypothetical protein TRFO_03455 [Tritrichomonas foetus]|eukprot:OHT13041.1 hypothetical protein TRFO_03455 [Tritrichomonas foetus]
MERNHFESKFTKKNKSSRSKSYEPEAFVVENPLDERKKNEKTKKRINDLEKENKKLQDALRHSIKKNKELLSQLRAKKELEEKLEEEKNTTIELQILVNACRAEIA